MQYKTAEFLVKSTVCQSQLSDFHLTPPSVFCLIKNFKDYSVWVLLTKYKIEFLGAFLKIIESLENSFVSFTILKYNAIHYYTWNVKCQKEVFWNLTKHEAFKKNIKTVFSNWLQVLFDTFFTELKTTFDFWKSFENLKEKK